jgi:hypothetical protein
MKVTKNLEERLDTHPELKEHSLTYWVLFSLHR